MLKYLIVLMPNAIKLLYYRAKGAKIGKCCRIGITLIEAECIELGDFVHIGHFNILWRLKNLKIASGSTLNDFNWITGARTGSFSVGRNSAITRFHFFEASGCIYIKENTIIAGRSSHFFTHGISSTNLDDVRPINIGPWCYVGSSSRFVPGSGIARGTFVGMGSVVTRQSSDEYVLIAGAPAVVRKQLSARDAYFDRPFLPHGHHPGGYDGGLGGE